MYHIHYLCDFLFPLQHLRNLHFSFVFLPLFSGKLRIRNTRNYQLKKCILAQSFRLFQTWGRLQKEKLLTFQINNLWQQLIVITVITRILSWRKIVDLFLAIQEYRRLRTRSESHYLCKNLHDQNHQEIVVFIRIHCQNHYFIFILLGKEVIRDLKLEEWFQTKLLVFLL